MSAFRARKEGRALTPAEKYAEREYEARRRKRRVQVMLASEEEVAAWRKAAREAGYRTTGEWVFKIVRSALDAEIEGELQAWRNRAVSAERTVALLENRLTILEDLTPITALGRGS